ncbi:hypothetical protein [Microbacterium sp. NPDC058389]|uniref:hypothetical protein n=1 Tax=Microbacterium sp. NPDC058389 TaxID=3346475 RepID=UPI0036482ED9
MNDIYCSTPPWPTTCLDSLARILETGDRDLLRAWIGNHVDDEETAWLAYVVAVAALASELQARAGRVAAALFGEPVTFAPANEPNATESVRDVEQVVAMLLNNDMAGIVGHVAGIRDRGAFDEFCDSLADLATAVLRLEASGAHP